MKGACWHCRAPSNGRIFPDIFFLLSVLARLKKKRKKKRGGSALPLFEVRGDPVPYFSANAYAVTVLFVRNDFIKPT